LCEFLQFEVKPIYLRFRKPFFDFAKDWVSKLRIGVVGV